MTTTTDPASQGGTQMTTIQVGHAARFTGEQEPHYDTIGLVRRLHIRPGDGERMATVEFPAADELAGADFLTRDVLVSELTVTPTVKALIGDAGSEIGTALAAIGVATNIIAGLLDDERTDVTAAGWQQAGRLVRELPDLGKLHELRRLCAVLSGDYVPADR